MFVCVCVCVCVCVRLCVRAFVRVCVCGKSNFIRNAACTRTNISIVINCQHVALHGCHLAKSRLPVTPSSLKNNHHYYRYTIHVCSITTQYKRRIIKVKLHILLDITKTVLIQ